jgi:hypothetical protein
MPKLPTGTCSACKKERFLPRRDLCTTCYQKALRAVGGGSVEGKCLGCNRFIWLRSKGLCATCAKKSLLVEVVCVVCRRRVPGRKKTSTCLSCYEASRRAKQMAKPGAKERSFNYSQKTHYKNAYGLTLLERDQLLASQGGRCAICAGEIFFDARLHRRKAANLDHCHASGHRRGVLCNCCNMAVGFLQDDPARLASAIRYLQAHTERLAGLPPRVRLGKGVGSGMYTREGKPPPSQHALPVKVPRFQRLAPPPPRMQINLAPR